MNMRWSATAFAVALLAASMPATADEPLNAPTDHASIGDAVGAHARGRTAINQAAGQGNAQTNLAAFAVSADRLGLMRLQSWQGVAAGARERDASVRIDGAAFQSSQGLLSINQAAGAGNAQANLFALGHGSAALAGIGIGQGVSGLDDATLAGVAGAAPLDGASTPVALREAVIAGDAFRGSQGVVQLNQTAGVGNRSANAIVLLLPGGGP